jgi:hypothetical protein
MRDWLGPAEHTPAADAYRALATTATGASRSCLAGDVDACATTLTLVAAPADRLSAWFTPRQRRGMVLRAASPWYARVDRSDSEVAACLDEDRIESCDAVLSRIRWPEAVDRAPEILASLFQHALRVGGEGAWARAVEDPQASTVDVLTRAADRDLDALIADWRAHLTANRPAAYAGLSRSALVVSFWVLVLAVFALRSTRWRLA